MIRAVLFPGQGSQYKGMGKNLFEKYPNETALASQILGYDIKKLCIDDPNDLLKKTEYTQPAIFTVSALHYLEYCKDNGKPQFLAGHSLGEYNALFAAGAFDFETGLRLVQKRGALMGAASGGGMLAVLRIDSEELEKQLQAGGFDKIDVANFNTPNQIVVAGKQEDIDDLINYFDRIKTMVVPLQVSAPFHSRYMESASIEFAHFLKQFHFNELQIPVVANSTAQWYNSNIKEILSNQINSSVQWVDSIRLLMGENVTEFKEMGSAILTKMVNEIEKKCTPIIISTPKNEDIEKDIFLGSKEFCKDYNIKYPYVAGAMYRGVASPEMVVKLGKANMIGFYGTGGLSLDEVSEGIQYIKSKLINNESFGMNLLHHFGNPELEMKTVELYLQENIKFIEASAFMQMTKALVYFRIKGLRKDHITGKIYAINRIMAKISRPEVAEVFMNPATERLINQLLDEGKISTEQAEWAKHVPMSYDICVEADSGGHTDSGIAMVILPVIQQQREKIQLELNLSERIRVGLAGGIGTPESIVCAFMMGADFVLTGSINQCTVEAGTSDIVKDLLQDMNVQDTDYAPAGDMFEMGAKVQVLKKGVLFSPRANKLYTLYNQYESLDQLPENIVKQLEKNYFKKTLNEVWQETKSYHIQKGNFKEIEKAESNGKLKMAMVFKWYFGFSSSVALKGEKERKVDFQVHTGPALGAFNQWVKDTPLESWRARHVDLIGEKLMKDAGILFQKRVKQIINN